MNLSIGLEDIDRDPGLITVTARLRSGQMVVFRPLAGGDARTLGQYFLGLSAATRALYAPHPFDQATADELCRNVRDSDATRMIAVARSGDGERIIAYFIVLWHVQESDVERYAQRGTILDSGTDCTLAPSVADEYQNQGLGSAMMEHILGVARRLGRRRMVLWGGTRATNERAIHFYEKFGFRKVGEFLIGALNNYDMLLEIQKPEHRAEDER